MSYQDDKYMPYVYYRVRPIKYHMDAHLKDATHPEAVIAGDYVDDFIEVNYSMRNGGTILMCHMDMIVYPNPITAEQIHADSPNVLIDVMFGYEIAQVAASMAMESLGSARVQSLQQQALASEPQ